MKTTVYVATLLVAAFATTSCGKPTESGLRESFTQQLAANKYIKDFQHQADDLTFTAPGAEGGEAKWRVHIDSAVVEETGDAAQPYKGTVKSSWYSNDQLVTPRGRESNLPIPLTSNGLAQDCWAMWDNATKQWGW